MRKKGVCGVAFSNTVSEDVFRVDLVRNRFDIGVSLNNACLIMTIQGLRKPFQSFSLNFQGSTSRLLFPEENPKVRRNGLSFQGRLTNTVKSQSILGFCFSDSDRKGQKNS